MPFTWLDSLTCASQLCLDVDIRCTGMCCLQPIEGVVEAEGMLLLQEISPAAGLGMLDSNHQETPCKGCGSCCRFASLVPYHADQGLHSLAQTSMVLNAVSVLCLSLVSRSAHAHSGMCLHILSDSKQPGIAICACYAAAHLRGCHHEKVASCIAIWHSMATDVSKFGGKTAAASIHGNNCVHMKQIVST